MFQKKKKINFYLLRRRRRRPRVVGYRAGVVMVIGEEVRASAGDVAGILERGEGRASLSRNFRKKKFRERGFFKD